MLNYLTFPDLSDLPPNMYKHFLWLMPNPFAETDELFFKPKLHYIDIRQFLRKKIFKNQIKPSSSKFADTDRVFGLATPRKYLDYSLEVSSTLIDHFYTEISTMHVAHLCTSLLFPQYLLRHLSVLEILVSAESNNK